MPPLQYKGKNCTQQLHQILLRSHTFPHRRNLWSQGLTCVQDEGKFNLRYVNKFEFG